MSTDESKIEEAQTEIPWQIQRLYPPMTKEERIELMRSAMEEFHAAEQRPPLPPHPSPSKKEHT